MSDRQAVGVDELRKLLEEVIEEVSGISTTVWSPAIGSPASIEAASTHTHVCSDGVAHWGPGPSQVVWAACEVLYAAVLEHARATARLLLPPFRVWAPAVQARSMLEAASQIHWLLDSVPSGRARVGRLYTLRLSSSNYLQTAYDAVGQPGEITDYGKPPAAIIAEAAHLGLTPLIMRGALKGYEGQRLPRYAARAKAMLGDEGPYNILSGAAHAEIWSLLSGSPGHAPSPFGLTTDEHESQAGDLAPIVVQAMHALIAPPARAGQFFGRGATARNLRTLGRKIDGALGL